MKMMDFNQIYCGDAVEVLRHEFDSIDLCITSPPYDNLRDYKGYKFDYIRMLNAIYYALKEGGTLVWVVGDATINGSETGTSFRQALCAMDIGFKLHDTMIYEKNGAAYPANAKSNRYSQTFEYMFVLTKGKPKTHNLLRDKPNRWAGFGTFGQNSERQKDGSIKARGKFVVPEFSYRNNIWKINNGYGYTTKDKFAYEHPAMFPESLANDHILTWSNEGDVVLDPMCGSGTVLKMAKINNRRYLGIDISEEYCGISTKRVDF